jgi:hypothetical protein
MQSRAVATRVLAAVVVVVGCCASAGAERVCGPWKWASPLPQGNNLAAVTYGNGMYVAVGDAGTVLVSRDAAAWTVARVDTMAGLKAVHWDGRRFVAVGDRGTVALSSDGLEWTVRSVGSEDGLSGVASGGGRLVAVGANGAIFWSVGGGAWQRADAPTSSQLAAVTWSGTQFVAAESWWSGDPGAVATAGILVSPDGLAWSRTAIPEAMSFQALTGNGSRLVAAGAYCVIPGASPDGWCYPGALVSVSDDGGTSWSTVKLEKLAAFGGVVWTGSQFLALQAGAVLTSPDAMSWAPGGALGISATALAPGDFGLVAVGAGGSIATSPDGARWTPSPSSAPRLDLQDVVWTGTQFVAVGAGPFANVAIIRTSPDGLAWTEVEPDALRYRQGLSAIAWNGSTFVALGDTYLAASPDGFSWSVTAEWVTPYFFRLSGVVWTGTKFVVVGSGLGPDGFMEGLVLTSTDGLDWTQVHAQAGAWFRRVAARGETLLVTGADASDPGNLRIYVSADGTTWRPVTDLPMSALNGIVWAGTQFVGIGGFPAKAYTSADGVAWVEHDPGVPGFLDRVVWDGREVVAVGQGGMVAWSLDGNAWSAEFAGTWYELLGVATAHDRSVVVGDSGTILSKQCGEAHRPRRRLPRAQPLSSVSPRASAASRAVAASASTAREKKNPWP